MALLQKDEIGILDIELVQNAKKDILLTFETVELENETIPLDLRTVEPIRMDVKARANVNEKPFISWAVGRGLTITGEDFNLLSFSFENEFTNTEQTEWFYDLKVGGELGPKYYIKGKITVDNRVTK